MGPSESGRRYTAPAALTSGSADTRVSSSCNPLVGRRLGVAAANVHRQHVGWHDTEINTREAHEAPDNKARSYEKHHRETDLENDEQCAGTMRALTRGTCGVVERFNRVQHAGMSDWLRATQERCRQYGEDRECGDWTSH
jgi:hypothetical protein